jgi:hypothetical protein
MIAVVTRMRGEDLSCKIDGEEPSINIIMIMLTLFHKGGKSSELPTKSLHEILPLE